MEPLLIVFLTFVAIFVIMAIFYTIVSTFILIGNYKYYHKIYNELPNYEFFVLGEEFRKLIYAKKTNFIWFVDDNSFCLEKEHYLHNALFTFLNPYACYWMIKYRKWFKDHVNANEVKVGSLYDFL